MLLGLLSPRATHRWARFPTPAGQKWFGKRGEVELGAKIPMLCFEGEHGELSSVLTSVNL